MTSPRDPSAERIAAARAYVDALVSHDPSSVVLHPDCTATVDGHSVTTRYIVHVRPKTLRLGATVSETFVVDEDNRIRAIVAHFGLPRPQRI